ncbi:MAG: aminomethyltransferase family protein, partial [Gammaproteobacteria bacterium]
EHALWFADGPGDAHEQPTFARSRSHAYVGREVRAVREAVGAIEIANFSKHAVSGPGARAFLDRVLAGRIPAPGRIALSPMLTPKGRLYGDLTVACLGDEDFMIFGSGAMQEAHRRWFERWLPGSGVEYRNATDEWHGIAISGPRSRELLSALVREDVSNAALPFMAIRCGFVAGVPAILARISFSGELGYEIYVPPAYQLRLAEAVEEAGAALGLRWYGARALMSLRLEKGWGVWTLDYRPDFTPAESGLDAFIRWDKDFIGREAALAARGNTPARRLVVLTVESDVDVCGDEAILAGDEAVGYVSSGGYAHHAARSVAFAYVASAHAEPGTVLAIEISGTRRAATMLGEPLHDPGGARMRS